MADLVSFDTRTKLFVGTFRDHPTPEMIPPLDNRDRRSFIFIAFIALAFVGFFAGRAVGVRDASGIAAGVVVGILFSYGENKFHWSNKLYGGRFAAKAPRQITRTLRASPTTPGSARLTTNWAGLPETSFDPADVRAVEISRYVDFDDAAGRRNAQNLSNSANSSANWAVRMNERAHAVASIWVVYLTLGTGRQVNVIYQPDRQSASIFQAGFQAFLRDFAQRQSGNSATSARRDRVTRLGDSGDAPL